MAKAITRFAQAGAPTYFARRGKPHTRHELAAHSCINLRMASGGIYAWEFEKDGRELNQGSSRRLRRGCRT